MIFEDIFYPDNPKRRQEVADLQADIRVSFMSFKDTWNECAALLNPIISTKFSDATLLRLDYDLTKETVENVVKKIKFVIDDIKPKWDKMAKDAGLPKDLPLDGVALDEVKARVLAQWLIPAGAAAAASSFAAYYVFRAFQFMSQLVRMAGGSISWVVSWAGGALAGLVVGAAAFIITDLIVDAIAGAIRRKELNEQIDALREFKKQVTDPLNAGKDKLRGIMQSVKDGVYRISDQYIIFRKPDGTYDIMKIVSTSAVTAATALSLAGSLRVHHGGDTHSMVDYMILSGADIAPTFIASVLDRQRQIDQLLA